MSKDQQTKDGSTTAMRWTARILALLAVGLVVFFAIELGAGGFPERGWGDPGCPLLSVGGFARAGVVVAWRWELVGGIMTVAGVAGIMALVCLGSGTDMLFCAFLFTLPLLVAGALYLGCCWRTRMAEVAQES